jgi:methylthioribose-1-phosphate isomerase
MRTAKAPTLSLTSDAATRRLQIVDQTLLPFALEIRELVTWQDCAEAILSMRVRGAPLIGVTAAYGMALAASANATDDHLDTAYNALLATRPTAVNLAWALAIMCKLANSIPHAERAELLWAEAVRIESADAATNYAIGQHGLALIKALHEKLARPINILTHCNAGRMACITWGTATAPIYLAAQSGLPVHVYVEETRPRNQGLITQWELQDAGITHTYLVDNAGGHLMQQGKVDVVLVGADRITLAGDAANKIGTYLKALAAYDNHIPFYVLAPVSTIDTTLVDVSAIEIEERNGDEVRLVHGTDEAGRTTSVRMLPAEVSVTNPGFDVTPARLITGIITELGVAAPQHLGAMLNNAAKR